MAENPRPRTKKTIPVTPTAVGFEAFQITKIWFQHGVFGMPFSLLSGFAGANNLDPRTIRSSVFRNIGDRLIRLVSALGPVYGKAAQIGLSRVDITQNEILKDMHLSNIYGNWPSIPFEEVELILDTEIPRWRQFLKVEPLPIGVASIAQVHEATDNAGRNWVLKIVKPDSEKRLHQTVEAIFSILDFYRPLAFTAASKRLIREIKDLCMGLRRELDLEKERETILDMQDRLTDRKKGVLRIPEVHPDLHSKKVLVVEQFHGTKISDIAAGKVTIPAEMRRKLARKMLKELLVQVFEIGLFHGDPHAGNLMLLDDGAVGLFDWGLAGELAESDRVHIAAMLKAVIAMDIEKLALALQEMAVVEGKDVPLSKIKKELKKVSTMVKKRQAAKEKISLNELISACLDAAQKMDLRIPDGLVLMAKSLITVEGLAKGIDPDVKLGVIASPLLLRAARPSFQDMWNLGMKAPKMLFKMVADK